MIRVKLISFEELIKQLIKAPENLDCIFADEIQGPVLQSQSKVLFGLQNLLPLAHTGLGINIFEPLSTSFLSIKQGVSNPVALIYSLALLLSRFGLQEEARSIQLAIDKASERGMFTLERTLPAPFNCNQLGDFIAAAIIDSEDIGVINDENIDLGKSTII
jgi:isocitrate/isopropylmalate dehydrogenase